MPPKLKGECSIFWLVWIISLAYWMGIWTWDSAYVVRSQRMKKVEVYMFTVCITIALLSFVGCCFLFFDISHFGCVLLYGIPLGIVVPGLCIAGMLHLSTLDIVGEDSIRDKVVAHWEQYGSSPFYLTNTEKQMGCCGLYGPFDYRSFIYGKHCESQVLDAPYSCCNLQHLFSNGEYAPSKQCSAIASGDIFNLTDNCNSNLNKTVLDSSNNTEPIVLDAKTKCNCIDNTANILEKFQKEIFHEGCVDYLLENTQRMMEVHLAFFIIFPLLSLIMLATFLKAWCNSPELMEESPSYKNGGSSSSL